MARRVHAAMPIALTPRRRQARDAHRSRRRGRRHQARPVTITMPTLIEPTQRLMATGLDIPIDQIRAAWTERDEQALPATVRAAIATLAGAARDQ